MTGLHPTYPIRTPRLLLRPLTEAEGGGYLIEFPDLPGCMSDGDTIEEAIANGEDAKRCWIGAMRDAGRPIPPMPGQDMLDQLMRDVITTGLAAQHRDAVPTAVPLEKHWVVVGPDAVDGDPMMPGGHLAGGIEAGTQVMR